jgi:hypothetical protein
VSVVWMYGTNVSMSRQDFWNCKSKFVFDSTAQALYCYCFCCIQK